MGDVAVFVVMLMFFVLGVLLGYKIGQELGERAETNRQYWLYNLAAVLVGVLLSAVVSALGLRSLAGLTIGMIAGAIVGLKFGFGKSVGVWEKHDRHFRVNKGQLDAASKPASDADRELISVHDPDDGKRG